MQLLGSNHTALNVQPTINAAISQVSGPSAIRITSNLYEEMLTITEPDLYLAPREKGGEVTIKQKENRCICIDVGKDNVVTLKNLRMINFVKILTRSDQSKN